jgi:hypothetical protein
MKREKGRMFFFEKKNQKTFTPLSRLCGADKANSQGGELTKFFCFFLFTKRSSFFHV